MHLEQFHTAILPLKDKLFRFALRLTNERAEAEDVVQEVFIKMWNQREQWDNLDDVEAWLMRLTRNLAIDQLRSKKRKSTDSINPTVFKLASIEQSPYEQVAQKDSLSQIELLMQQLPEAQSSVLHLREVEGMNYQEISTVLEMSLAQVKVNLHRARQKMRELILQRNLRTF